MTAASLPDRVLALATDLRAAGVEASLAEALDGIAALTHLDLLDRELVRVGLQSTLIKRPEDRDVFGALFERHFAPTPAGSSGSAGSAGSAPAAPSPDGAGGGDGAPTGEGTRADGIREALASTLRAGDDEALVTLAADAVAGLSGIDVQPGSERYFLFRVLRALDLADLLVAALAAERAERPDVAPGELRRLSDDVRERLERYRRLLAVEIRRRLPAPGEPGVGLLAPRRVEDLDVGRASTTELRQLEAAVRPLARKLASRIGQRRRRHRHGRLDVRRTLRRSLDAGGTPLEPAFRRARPSKPRLVVLCDISGSVAEFAHFTLMLLHALQAELAGLRSFVFVDGVAEVTGVMERAEVTLDPRLLVTLPGVVAHDGHSDYERALGAFVERHDDALGPATTVLVAGDARSNYRGSGVDSLRAVRQRCRRLYWFNPEPEHEWGDTDSEVDTYRSLCDGVFEVRSLTQLADAVAAIV